MAGTNIPPGINEVAVIVAHADDETLGAGGFIPIIRRQGKVVKVIIASNGFVTVRRTVQNNKSHVYAACKILGLRKEDIYFLGLDDQNFEKYYYSDIVSKLRNIKMNPDLIITHVQTDLNIDHKIISDCTLIYGRSIDRQINIIGCDVPNSTEWKGLRFNANLYVNISNTINIKKRAFSCYKNELKLFPHPWSMKGLEVLAMQRGMEVGMEYAEAYEVIRWFV